MNGYGEGLRGQIIEVWAHNLEEELDRIRDVVERYPYIALDTEFPGIVARPTSNALDYNYRTVKYNVDLLKVIQLGLTFADSRGRLAEGTCTWQFNFRFDLNEDMYAQNSIDFLKQSGIDFDKQQKKGVEVHDFGELIMNSGLVMNEDVKWISFHGCYDFGYLLKLLTCEALPESENAFFELVQDFFPSLYDIKFLLRDLPNFNLSQGSSLQKVSEQLNVQRVGPQHQAGSDSLVTCRTFFNLVESYFDGKIDEAKFSGVIYGLGATAHKRHRGPHGALTSAPSLDLGGPIHAGDLKQQQDGSSSTDMMMGGPGAMSRYVSAGPGSRLGSHPQQQQQQGPWGSMGRVSSGVVGSMRQQQQQQQQHSQALLGIPSAAIAAADSSGSVNGDRLRGAPGGPHAGIMPGNGGSRGFGSELHRTGSAPPAPLLCSSSGGRVLPAAAGGLAVAGRHGNGEQQQRVGVGGPAAGALVFEGTGGAAGAPRRP
ncbi:CCR4-NOT transcription complex subunit, putative [Eimeria tenella]|uniref:poly(A)-specific ribonuclease n=1 Tax=Eimeria tenella TaxID=5802 RepID=U6KJ07_EIMTE|nr:CCR4-NOT transcription complex subunit, putative [Eimeria tenella]CDJ38010.1 CCR4-NOT transcription complex subunit, putative [Eimeria tenella]|eukprot:XP_013228848.1 CCR4-NOT transcription complex subunit, putative [Eimeria tenella]